MRVENPPAPSPFGINGKLSLTVLRPDGTVRDFRSGSNIMCTAGVTAIASALVWSGVQDQATALGLTSPTYLTPLWGAVGSGAGVVAASDTALFTELGRQTVGAGAAGPATPSIPASATWLFYFPQPATTWTVTEAGVFANGSSNPANTATAGVLLDHWGVSPSVTVPTTDTLILQASFSITGM
jgi:hypothetical protein